MPEFLNRNMEKKMKNREYLICVDSDGCVMDTMDSKHILCFGPCFIEEWNLGKWEEEILQQWNDINLYQVTRGINRFRGLAKALREVDSTYVEVEGIDELERWVKESTELSETALMQEINQSGSEILKKALSWSGKVNEKINTLSEEEKKAFEGAEKALEKAHRFADIAVVSSANLQAVEEEWQRCQVLEYVDRLMTQSEGSKKDCIRKLLEEGYQTDKVLMIGDAVGDYEAAKKNGVYFYPILVRQESKSWQEFTQYALDKFLAGEYGGIYQEERVKEFERNFEKE